MGERKNNNSTKNQKRGISSSYHASSRIICLFLFHLSPHEPLQTDTSIFSGIIVGTINMDKSASLTAYKGEWLWSMRPKRIILEV